MISVSIMCHVESLILTIGEPQLNVNKMIFLVTWKVRV
jgi:hypothetical protein